MIGTVNWIMTGVLHNSTDIVPKKCSIGINIKHKSTGITWQKGTLQGFFLIKGSWMPL